VDQRRAVVRARRRRSGAHGAGRTRAPRRSGGGARRRAGTARRRLNIRTITRLLFAAYFFEAGLILSFTPWSVFWERNHFTDGHPRIEAIVESPYARGAATGIGVITVLAGLGELGSVFVTRWKRSDAAPDPADETPGA
jgi:hypothetical protein